jgi:uncharacterized membrane protein
LVFFLPAFRAASGLVYRLFSHGFIIPFFFAFVKTLLGHFWNFQRGKGFLRGWGALTAMVLSTRAAEQDYSTAIVVCNNALSAWPWRFFDTSLLHGSLDVQGIQAPTSFLLPLLVFIR